MEVEEGEGWTIFKTQTSAFQSQAPSNTFFPSEFADNDSPLPPSHTHGLTHHPVLSNH